MSGTCNSSCERVVFPETCVLTDHILKLAEGIIANLRFFPENIKRCLELMRGLNIGEAVMIELARRGVGRQEAHEIVRTSTMEGRESGRHMKEVLMSRPEVTGFISAGEIEGVWTRRGISGLWWSRWRLLWSG